MFPSSSQRKFWMFKSEEDIMLERLKSREKFIAAQQNMTEVDYLSLEDSNMLLYFFERKLMDFCCKFKPAMPRSVIGTTFVYFKRFYLNNSVMDYHPKEILVTAAYLACKVEEFNVSLEQFVANINGNKERAMEIILNHELLVMSEIKFHLTVHTPWRPLEGFILDIKARFLNDDPNAIEKLRSDVDKFLIEVNFSNACLMYAPSQIALAAIIHAASRQGLNLDTYVTKILFGQEEGQENLANIIEAVRNVRLLVKNLPAMPSTSLIKDLCDRLEKCRNQSNNPDSQAYKRKIQELLEDDEDRIAAKMARYDH